MKISETIAFFQKKLNDLGDVDLITEKSDGREGWTSGFNPELRRVKSGVYKLVEGY